MSFVMCHLSCVTCHQRILFCREKHLDSKYNVVLYSSVKNTWIVPRKNPPDSQNPKLNLDLKIVQTLQEKGFLILKI